MFGSIRDKFQFMQEGLTASLRGLTLTEAPTKPKKVVNTRNVNYDAGADLLHHFQVEWNKLHELSEENAQKAQEADALISTIHEKLELQWNNFSILNSTLKEIPKINKDVQALMDKIGALQVSFEEVEESIFNLEYLQEILDLQNFQLEQRVQLALYKEKKLAEYNILKEKLAKEHAEKVLKHEQEQVKHLKERQQTFDEAFKEQLQEYKKTGAIPKPASSTQKGPSLDEIVLDTDSTEFDEFFKE